MRTFPDAQLPTATQQQAMLRLTYLAFLELRVLSREGKPKQAAALADSFQNLPLMMNRPESSMSFQRAAFSRYGDQFGFRDGFNYVAEIDKIHQMKG